MSFPTSGAPAVWSPEDQRFAKALVVCAHPDDVEFGSAGTAARLVDDGTEVRYCIATDGEAGGNDRRQSRAEVAEIRRQEQQAAAASVGVEEVIFLGYPDGSLRATMDLRRDITRVIRAFAPDLVVAPSPERNWSSVYASHPDHLAAGEATVNAVYPDSRNPFAHPELLAEGLEPHTVSVLWLTSVPTPNLVVDITEVFPRKLTALACHQSQGGGDPNMEELLAGWGEQIAVAAGLPEGRLAEQYWEMRTG